MACHQKYGNRSAIPFQGVAACFIINISVGPIFRISPNCVMVNDPRHIQEYWSFDRSEYFLAFQLNPGRTPTGIARPFKQHLAQKKLVASAVRTNAWKVEASFSNFYP